MTQNMEVMKDDLVTMRYPIVNVPIYMFTYPVSMPWKWMYL